MNGYGSKQLQMYIWYEGKRALNKEGILHIQARIGKCSKGVK
jgi:hypothetical protein